MSQFLLQAAEGSSRLPPRTLFERKPDPRRGMESESAVSPTTDLARMTDTSPVVTCGNRQDGQSV